MKNRSWNDQFIILPRWYCHPVSGKMIMGKIMEEMIGDSEEAKLADHSEKPSSMKTSFHLKPKPMLFDMKHESILGIPGMLKHADSFRPIGTIHKSPARSAGSGRGKGSRVLKGRLILGTALGFARNGIAASMPGYLMNRPSRTDFPFGLTPPGTSCRAFMRGPFGTTGNLSDQPPFQP